MLADLTTIYISRSDERLNSFAQTPGGQFLAAGNRTLMRLQTTVYPTKLFDKESKREVVAEGHLMALFQQDLWNHHHNKPASVGTAVSHYNALYTATSQSRKGWALIIEEDVVLLPGFIEGLVQVAEWIDSGYPCALIHLASGTMDRYQESIQVSEKLLQSHKPPLALHTYPSRQTASGKWVAQHVGAGFKCYLVSGAVRERVVTSNFKWRMRAVELDFINRVWELPSNAFPLEQSKDQELRGNAYKFRVTVVRGPLADHTVQYTHFFRGSGRMETDAMHEASAYLMIWCADGATLERRIHLAAIGLEMACAMKVGYVLVWDKTPACPIYFQDVLAVDGQAASARGLQWMRVLYGDMSAAQAYWGNKEYNVGWHQPDSAQYERFCQAWNSWGPSAARAQNFSEWPVVRGEARALLVIQEWACQEKDQLFEDAGMDSLKSAGFTIIFPPGAQVTPTVALTSKAPPPPWRAATEGPRKRIYHPLQSAAEDAWRVARDKSKIPSKQVYWAAETEAQVQWLHQKRAVDRQTFMRIAVAPAVQRRLQELDDIEAYERAREAGTLKRVTGPAGHGAFKPSMQLTAAHLAAVYENETYHVIGSDLGSWSTSLKKVAGVAPTTDDVPARQLGYGPADQQPELPKQFPPHQELEDIMPSLRRELLQYEAAFLRPSAVGTLMKPVLQTQHWASVPAAAQRVLAQISVETRDAADEWLMNRHNKAISTKNSKLVLASQLGTALVNSFDELGDSRKKYMPLISGQPAWGWLKALVLTIINAHREAKGLRQFWHFEPTGTAGVDILQLSSFNNAWEASQA